MLRRRPLFLHILGLSLASLGTPVAGASATTPAGGSAPRGPTPPQRGAQPPRSPPRPLVVLDPGHGGKDPGCIGATGTYEKRVVLATALELRKRLQQGAKVRVALTRSNDRFVPLETRVRFAQSRGAALFISIHADAADQSYVRGASVYTLAARASDPLAAGLALRENRADRFRGPEFTDVSPEVARILSSLVRRETVAGSQRIARTMVAALDDTGPMLPNSHRQAGFVVLQAPDIPSTLVELGFLSNRADEALLRQPRHRARLAAAMAQAIHAWADAQGRVQAAAPTSALHARQPQPS
jgi:N-acetylmuramoyl-L-alanine amidase